nr:hypothetical protein [uncultured Schaedlerella sp.]
MKVKSVKLTALVLAVTMAMFSPISVHADDPEEATVPNDGLEMPGQGVVPPDTGAEALEEETVPDVDREAQEKKEQVDADEGKLGGGNETGIGEVEGSVETDIYQVVLPTIEKSAFDFIIDPQGLINKTNGAAYDGKTFEDNSTLFFKRTDGKVKEDYSNTSDVMTIKNMGSKEIDVSLHISVTPESLGGIQLTGDREFTNDKNASLYLALVDGKNIVPIGPDGIDMDVTISAAPEEAYEYGYDSEKDQYTYQLKADHSGIEFGSYSFQLTGAANGNGDWSKLTKVKPQIQVSWKIVSKEK